jgi:hypothetical protein
MDDVSRRLTGQPLGYLLTRLHDAASGKVHHNGTTAEGEKDTSGLTELVAELQRLERDDNKHIARVIEKY